ncbi:DUF4309 domain-containing protein [Anaerobacillus sp. CMMVII]|uniref:DUF4309 domain-containing protein n=1 Tax=Anaerobacillus sp. CMMVII TaxID=2755588 RepID=UPI0021B76627|nr:DUF4309 domain-containing protein [Anaerobacillus sp. CMMVII]MCT8137482.1 DUF4309 domain-containing protein [Anaerobacillus sp. CMMVII]
MKRIIFILVFWILMGCNVTENYNQGSIETLYTETPLISSEELLDFTTSENESFLRSHLERIKNVKEIKRGIYQGVIEELTETEYSIQFFTWKKTVDSIELIDTSEFNDQMMNQGIENGQFYLGLWNEIDSFFLSYHDLPLSKEFLDAGMQGHLPTSQIKLGMSSEEVINFLGQPVVTDWYYGGILYSYNDMAYVLDDELNVIAINMPGNRIASLLKDVSKELGKPTSIQYSEIEDIVTYIYELGSFTISFEATQENSKVLAIWLLENR